MSIGGILAGALAGAGSAVQYNAQENIKKKREEALLKLEAKNRAALQGAQNAQSMSNTMKQIQSREDTARMQEEGRNKRALLSASTYLEGEDGNAIMVQPKLDGGFEHIDTGIAYNKIDKDAVNAEIQSARANVEMAAKALENNMLTDEQRSFYTDFMNQNMTTLQNLTSGVDQSEIDAAVLEALGADGETGEEIVVEEGGATPPPNPSNSTSNSNDYIPNGMNGPIPEPRATEAAGILDSAIAENAQRQAAEAEQQDRLRLSEEQAAERNAINEYNAALRSEVIGPLNKAQYFINKYQTAMPGTGNAGVPKDQVQQLGDEIYSVLQNSLNRDKYNAITDSAKNSVRTVFEELLALGYQPPQGNQ